MTNQIEYTGFRPDSYLEYICRLFYRKGPALTQGTHRISIEGYRVKKVKIHCMIISARQFEKLIVLLHYHLLQVSDICNIYSYVTFCVTNTRDFRALSTNNIVTQSIKKLDNRPRTQKLCVCFISQYIVFTFPLILLDIKRLENHCNYFYYNCQSNNDRLIGVLYSRNSNRGNKVMDRSCVSKWGSVRLSRFDLWA